MMEHIKTVERRGRLPHHLYFLEILPCPIDQKSYGNCWVVSMVTCIEAKINVMKRERSWSIDRKNFTCSIQYLMDLMVWNERTKKGHNKKAMDYLKSGGIVERSLYREFDGIKVSDEPAPVPEFKVSDVEFEHVNPTLYEIKLALWSHGPLMVNLCVQDYVRFWNHVKWGRVWKSRDNDSGRTTHTCVLAGIVEHHGRLCYQLWNPKKMRVLGIGAIIYVAVNDDQGNLANYLGIMDSMWYIHSLNYRV